MNNKTIFLSAGVPHGDMAENYAPAKPHLIKSAIRALAIAALGRRFIVWGGQPPITSMFLGACESLHVNYVDSVLLYQSQFFQGKYPPINVQFTKSEVPIASSRTREDSLKDMRKEMISRHDLGFGVFIGGMNGTEEEYRLFTQLHPQAKALLVPGPGGAARTIAEKIGTPWEELEDRKFLSLFYKALEIDENEPRNQAYNRIP